MKIIIIINLILLLILLYRSYKAFKVQIDIVMYHNKLSYYLPEVQDMVLSVKPLNKQYWLEELVKRKVKAITEEENKKKMNNRNNKEKMQ